jgi:hypothetical protein
MAGTVTGKDANLFLYAHSGGAALSVIDAGLTDGEHDHTAFGVGDFTLTLDKGTVEQELIGQVGNYFDQGSLSMDGSLTSIQFATSGVSDLLLNLVDAGTAGKWKYLAISGCVSDATDATYLSWFLVSCQVTGYDISFGDADTITEASVDFTVMDPFAVAYNEPCIMDC